MQIFHLHVCLSLSFHVSFLASPLRSLTVFSNMSSLLVLGNTALFESMNDAVAGNTPSHENGGFSCK